MRTGRRDWLWAVAVIVMMGAGIVAVVIALTSSSGPEPDEPPIAGLPCESGERLEYHVHATVRIVIDGGTRVIPTNVGVRPGECIYWLHTHDNEGLIHVEAPREDTYTLGQFFAIWGEPLSNTQILEKTTDANHAITATLNGETYNGNPADIALTDGAVVVVQYGQVGPTP